MSNDPNAEKIKAVLSISSYLGVHKDMISCVLPGHEDKNASFSISDDKGLWKCFACDKGGDIITLVMEMERIDYGKALKHLADKAGIRLEYSDYKAGAEFREQQQRAEKALEYAANYYHEAIFKCPGIIGDLALRLIGEDEIRRFRLGYADGSICQHVKTVGVEGLSVDDFVNAGLIYNGATNDYFQSRIIFPLLKNGKVLNLSGRTIVNEEPKYKHLAGRPTDYFYNEDALTLGDDEIFLFEGHPDTIVAARYGINALGVIGTSGMKHPEKLKRCKRIYICGDTDTAGKDAVEKWASAIKKHNPNAEILFIQLSDGCKDFNEWAKRKIANGERIGDFRALKEAAVDLLLFKITRLKDPEQLAGLWPLLESISEPSREPYFKAIKQQLPQLGLTAIRKYFKDWLKFKKINITNNSTVTAEDYQTANSKLPANIGFDGMTSHICLFAEVHREDEDGTETSTYEPVIKTVTVNPENGEYQTESVYLNEQNRFSHTSVPNPDLVQGRWSPESIIKFQRGKSHENTALLLWSLTDYFKRYIWHEDPMTYETLALFSMETYVARLFHASPYLAINGFAGSGKTNTLELLEQICFNAVMAANMSLSSMFRIIEKCFCTLIRDEAEDFNKKTPENQEELKILNAGYKASGLVTRSDKDKNGIVTDAVFRVYSPKIFAGINMLNDTLLTRSILIDMTKAPKEEVRELVSMSRNMEQWKREGAELRDRLNQWALTKFHLVREAYKWFPDQDVIINRDWEVWGPLLAIALVADNEKPLTTETCFTQRLLHFAEQKTIERKLIQEEHNLPLRVLTIIRDLLEEGSITQAGTAKDHYFSTALSNLVGERLKEEGFLKKKDMDPTWLKKILVQAKVTPKGPSKQVKDVNGKNKKAILIEEDKLKKALERL